MTKPTEATYTIKVDHRGNDPRVTVDSHGRVIARRTIKTYGDAASLGLLLTDPFTPYLPVAER